ncbi:hypothetical protein SAMN00790413_00378 [Deinococcus hopiensis KR-140]|uniref:Uncharacterized protein n=1 Tax=Deinococcus hopiensis KR-140 TaxID=695939 RepID=A0A1W1V7E4_9DEIO|nr:hypothetical protein SAMN00790413_00378 [Deinococcus hopiensis KR-140]
MLRAQALLASFKNGKARHREGSRFIRDETRGQPERSKQENGDGEARNQRVGGDVSGDRMTTSTPPSLSPLK